MIFRPVRPGSPNPPPPERPQMPPHSSSYVSHLWTKLWHTGGQESPDRIRSCSGAPQTHPSLAEQGAICAGKVTIEQTDLFVCTGAVDVVKLLRSSRSNLLEKAIILGANVLVDEQWKCTICTRNRDGTFRVNIRYLASATRSPRPDPQKPVALDKAKGVEGLMTIVVREGSDVRRQGSSSMSY